MNGGDGNDVFVFDTGFGHDEILGFSAGAGVGDVIRFSTTVFSSFSAVMAATADNGQGWAVITVGSNSIVLRGVSKAQLNANDFEFQAMSPAEGPLVLPGLEAGQQDKQAGPLVLPDLIQDDDPLILPGIADAGKWEFTPLVQPSLGDTMDPWSCPEVWRASRSGMTTR